MSACFPPLHFYLNLVPHFVSRTPPLHFDRNRWCIFLLSHFPAESFQVPQFLARHLWSDAFQACSFTPVFLSHSVPHFLSPISLRIFKPYNIQPFYARSGIFDICIFITIGPAFWCRILAAAISNPGFWSGISTLSFSTPCVFTAIDPAFLSLTFSVTNLSISVALEFEQILVLMILNHCRPLLEPHVRGITTGTEQERAEQNVAGHEQKTDTDRYTHLRRHRHT